MMDANIRTIRNKLVKGEKLTTKDLNSLEPLHDAIFDNDGHVVGMHGSILKEETFPLAGDFNLDYVDRSLLDGGSVQSSERLPPLVRYVGMVQDMLDPEYYESYDSLGRSKHFGEHFDVNSDDEAEESKNGKDANNANSYSDCLAERTPLVVVPIPFASDWLSRRGKLRSNSSKSVDLPLGRDMPKASEAAVVSPVSDSRGERKRGRIDVDSDSDGDSNMDDANSKSNQQTTQKQKSNGKDKIGCDGGEKERAESPIATDWWPPGTCGTSMDECPVLAKMCYDELLSRNKSKTRHRLEGGTGEDQIERHTEDSVAGGSSQNASRSTKSQSRRPLMLNDVASFVGVLSMNPWEADFSTQKSSLASPIGGIDGCGWESMFATENPTPPPSRLPRLHVLSYRQFDLDELAQRAIDIEKQNYIKSSNTNFNNAAAEREEVCGPERNTDSYNDSDDESEVEWSGFPTQMNFFSPGLASLLDGTKESLASPEASPWIRALWLCLLSEADRRQANVGIERQNDFVTPEVVRAGPSERALGCVSLQLSTPDVSSATSLYHDLVDTVLPGLCPVVAAIDLAVTTTAGISRTSLFPQKDNNGRLVPCPLQLPKGSVVVINYSRPRVGRNDDRNRNHPSKNQSIKDDDFKTASIQTVLNELVQHHKIPYRFEGGVTIPFDADYRVIVVTTQTQTVPCTLSALTTVSSRIATPVEASSPGIMCPTKLDLRHSLANGRSLSRRNNFLKFSSSLLERAQRDFLERRRRYHGSSSSKPLPGEDDFHRWLTLTKLEAKSRFSRDEYLNSSHNGVPINESAEGMDQWMSTQYFEPSVEDWERAMELSDNLCCMV